MAENRKTAEKPGRENGALLRLLVGILLTSVLTAALFMVQRGVPLWGAPRPEKVVAVRAELLPSGLTKETREEEDIKTACNLVNFLNYQPFTPVSEGSAELGPDVTITYILENGEELTAGANWITGWWKGEAHALKQPDLFVNLVEGLFFSREEIRQNGG